MTSSIEKDQIIVFDWDDTLLASTHICRSENLLTENSNLSEEEKKDLQYLENVVCLLLEKAKQLGKVVIISNSEEGWVQMSAKKWMPKVEPFLTEIPVIHARTKYKHIDPNDPFVWKMEAFKEHIDKIYHQRKGKLHILSVGDSIIERDVTKTMVLKHYTDSISKTVKLKEFPTIKHVYVQLQSVIEKLEAICSHETDLHLDSRNDLQFVSGVSIINDICEDTKHSCVIQCDTKEDMDFDRPGVMYLLYDENHKVVLDKTLSNIHPSGLVTRIRIFPKMYTRVYTICSTGAVILLVGPDGVYHHNETDCDIITDLLETKKVIEMKQDMMIMLPEPHLLSTDLLNL